VRGEQTAESDVDVLVEFAENSRVGLEYIDFWEELKLLLHAEVDIVTPDALKPWWRKAILPTVQFVQ